jgi:hypothetical protein
MRKHPRTRARWLLLATLGAFAVLVPSASADTTLPVWTCRASAGYVELDPLLGTRRVEPVLANGFPDRANPDTGQCASSDTGAQDVNIPGGTATEPTLALNAAFATTRITPEIGFAREQTAFANGGVIEPLRIVVGGLTIVAEAVTAEATGRCVGTTPTLTGRSQILRLQINDQTIEIPANGQPLDINLSPLIRVRLNEQVRTGTATTADEALTQRAVHIEVLPVPGAAQPVANIVIGEAKVDRHGAVCAPPPPPPACPAGSTAQNPGGNPLICVLPGVTPPCPAGSTPDPNAGGACVIIREVPAPCPAGSTPDPNAGGACVVVRQAPCPEGSTPDPNAGGACVIVRQAPAANCPNGTIRDPASNNCILVRDRPCPQGSTPDPATRVCVVPIVRNVGSGNGRIGDATGPRATCGRITMRFVRGGGRSLTNRFGTRVVTRGRLVTCGSRPRPIVGARVDVVHVLPGGRRLRKTGMRSRGGGRLTLILPLDLRSRRIEFAYRPDLNLTRVTSRVTLRLTVRDRRGRVLR